MSAPKKTKKLEKNIYIQNVLNVKDDDEDASKNENLVLTLIEDFGMDDDDESKSLMLFNFLFSIPSNICDEKSSSTTLLTSTICSTHI